MILTLDFSSEIPIYQQIRNCFVLAIAQGDLVNGERLPTVRALAQEAGVNAMTVNKAYQLLKQEGYIITDRRNGAMVQCEGKLNEAAWKEMQNTIRLLVAEARLGGVTRQELAAEVDQQYRRLKESGQEAGKKCKEAEETGGPVRAESLAEGY